MNTAMKREIVDFSIKVENGVVKEIGKSYVAMPEVHFKGGSIKWYEEKGFNLGTLQTGKVELTDGILQLNIDITNVSYRMNQTLEQVIEEAKKDYSDMIKEFNKEEGKQYPYTWSNKPVIRDFISLLVTFHAKDKSFQSVLSVGFHDADNDPMETEGSIFMDLSSYATELKDMARKALEERFF